MLSFANKKQQNSSIEYLYSYKLKDYDPKEKTLYVSTDTKIFAVKEVDKKRYVKLKKLVTIWAKQEGLMTYLFPSLVFGKSNDNFEILYNNTKNFYHINSIIFDDNSKKITQGLQNVTIVEFKEQAEYEAVKAIIKPQSTIKNTPTDNGGSLLKKRVWSQYGPIALALLSATIFGAAILAKHSNLPVWMNYIMDKFGYGK